MSNEVVIKKLEQVSMLLDEIEELLKTAFDDFQNDTVKIRAAERTFQLIVDLASDVNAQILLERGTATPDTYRQSFLYLGKEGVIPNELSKKLAESAGLRNILVHEYDFEEDYRKFYDSAKKFIPFYRAYIKTLIQ